MRGVTLSFIPGMGGTFWPPSIGFVVAFLKAASAAFIGSDGRCSPGDHDIPSLLNTAFDARSYRPDCITKPASNQIRMPPKRPECRPQPG